MSAEVETKQNFAEPKQKFFFATLLFVSYSWVDLKRRTIFLKIFPITDKEFPRFGEASVPGIMLVLLDCSLTY